MSPSGDRLLTVTHDQDTLAVLLEVFCDRGGAMDEVPVADVRQGDLSEDPIEGGQVGRNRCHVHQRIHRPVALVRCESDDVLTWWKPVSPDE